MWTELSRGLYLPFAAGKPLLKCFWRDVLFDPVSVDAGVMTSGTVQLGVFAA